jgi:formate--tetrahydrofolate ligase
MPTDIEIARGAELRPIAEIGQKLGISPGVLHTHGRHIAKLDHTLVQAAAERPAGRLVLVTAISPTPAGEGKTTTTVGLGDALNRIGKRAAICLREPSLGPCFGMKGGAAGGGYAQVVPMEQINLHFTGDFHAIGSAHNLLTALLDNHVYWGNALGIDLRRVTWKRVLDMNDRALRRIVNGLGGPANGFPREDGFDITVASEVMAIFCLARSLADLEERLGRIVIGARRDRTPVTAQDLDASGAMSVLLKDAFMPNLVQTLEGNPAFVHGGPFANIAHGCNSLVATRTALGLADYTVTEAGFGADLGAEKFIDIKCRKSGLAPDVAVLVATVRALKMHGGATRDALTTPNLAALDRGLANLARHIENLHWFGLPVIVAINHFTTDSEIEIAAIREACAERFGVEAILCRHWAEGSAGAEALAEAVVAACEGPRAERRFRLLYPDEMPLAEKIRTVAQTIYRAADVELEDGVRGRLAELEQAGFGWFPVCMAKTQYSFSADPAARGAPTGHVLPVREIRLAAGAEFIVALCGDIMTMPGLPRTPAASQIRLDAAGQIEGLF